MSGRKLVSHDLLTMRSQLQTRSLGVTVMPEPRARFTSSLRPQPQKHA